MGIPAASLVDTPGALFHRNPQIFLNQRAHIRPLSHPTRCLYGFPGSTRSIDLRASRHLRGSSRRRRRNGARRGGAVEHNGRVTASAHPEPTPATVKRLYARAFRCARPDCSRPLYKQDNDTGDLALNSRVAHIHARRPGGPRWIEMSAEDNRADANLLLLCIEHSYEVDELPDLYPAELLREWKQAQLDEHEQAQRGWPLTDADAGRVLEASSRAVEHHHAGAVLGAVRAAERLALAARGARRGPAARAAAWRAARARARNAFTAWDQDGNALYAEPSRHETEQHKAALLAALEDAFEALAPLADEAKVELAAVRASRPAVEPWSAWASRAVDEVIAASSTWPGPPGLEDDDRLDGALSGLAEATDALTAAWRGDPAAPPPPEPDPGPPPVLRDPLQDHRALLERARPYARVDHRPYDAALRAELAAAAEQAAGIPPVPSALAVGLSATCRLAAAVAGNADDDELAALAEQDARRRPLSAAVLLLAEAARAAEDRGRAVPQEQAEAALAALWDSVDWSDPALVGRRRRERPVGALGRVPDYLARAGQGAALAGAGAAARYRPAPGRGLRGLGGEPRH